MPRKPRVKSESGFYHIIIRGINKQTIFADDQDRNVFLNIVGRYREQHGFTLAAYCLMTNHVHMLLGDQNDELAVIMKKIAVSYVQYFNRKYDRTGPLFQDRYRSEPINDEKYFLAVFRYIHQNPASAGIASASQYRWSSYGSYLSGTGMVDSEAVYDLLGERSEIIGFINTVSEQPVINLYGGKRVSKQQAEAVVAEVFGAQNISSLKNCDKITVLETVDYLRRKGLSERQISELCGISRVKLKTI